MRFVKKILRRRSLRFNILKFLRFMPDNMIVKIQYRMYMKRKLNLKAPKRFSEKLQWLKLNNLNSEYSRVVDKYEVRSLIAEYIGPEYLVPILGVYDKFDDINFDNLPDAFVIKCTHGSQSNIVVKDKNSFDKKDAKSKFDFWMKQNWYYFGREYPYKKVKPRIMVESFIKDSDDSDQLTDYKFFCFNGKVDSVMLCLERNTGHPKFYFFDQEWELKRHNISGSKAPKDYTMEKPEGIDKMFNLASKLSIGFPFVRVDLYSSNKKIYVGELTLFPASGYDPNILDESDFYFGSLINHELENDPSILNKS